MQGVRKGKMGIKLILSLVKTHHPSKLLLHHWSHGFWKHPNDNYWDGSNKRNSKVAVEVIRQADGKAEAIDSPRWVVLTPGGRWWELQAEERAVGLRRVWTWRHRGYFSGSNEGLRDRGGSEKGLKCSRIWNVSFWRRKTGARDIYPGNFSQDHNLGVLQLRIIAAPTPSHLLFCFLKDLFSNCWLESCEAEAVLDL